MQSKRNYPIKYALMPIREITRPIYNYNDPEYETFAFIVSKCFLTKQITHYTGDGKAKEEYEVVFPYQKNQGLYNFEFDFAKREYPEFSCDGNCLNSLSVPKIFETYNKAKEEAKIQNKLLLAHSLSALPFSLEAYKEHEQLYFKNLEKYIEIQKKISESTTDLEIETSSILSKEVNENENEIEI